MVGAHLTRNIMPDSKKPKGSGLDREDSVQSDTIVLSNMDESMPAALAVDENGLFDIDKSTSKKLDAIKQAAKDREIQSLREEAGITSDPTEEKEVQI